MCYWVQRKTEKKQLSRAVGLAPVHPPDNLVTMRSKICLNHVTRGLVSQSVNGGTNDSRGTITQSGDGLYE